MGMSINAVQAASLAARDARADFVETYKAQIRGSHPLLEKVMELGIKSDKAQEVYGYPESAPHPKRKARGDATPVDSFGAKSFTVTNYRWELGIDVFEDDLQDDRLGGIMQQVKDGGTNFGILDERVFFQMLLGAADADLLPSVPTAPDGSNWFSSSTRFGVSGGNIEPGGGVTTAALITTDVWKAYNRLIRFLDTQGQPLNPQAAVKDLVIVYGSANEEMFRRAFQSSTVQGSSAGISNLNREAQGVSFTLWSTPRITDNDWFVFNASSARKAAFKQTRMPLQDNLSNYTNSDRSRDYDVHRWTWKARMGYGLTLPTMCVKIDN